MFRNIAIALAATAAIATPLAAQTASAPTDPKFLAQLREALKQNPEIIFEAVAIGQAKQRDQQASQQNAAVAQYRPTLFAAKPFGPVLGNPSAKTTVVEFLDYHCGYCKRAAPIIDKTVADDKDVRVIVVMRPILGPGSETMARFALAGNLQGKFQATHDALYDLPNGEVTDEVLKGVATKAGLNFEKAKADMTGDVVEAELKKHREIAEKMNVGGTPFFVTPKTVIPGAPPSQEEFLKAVKG